MSDYKPGVSVVLLAHNEEENLLGWFENVAWADEIVVVDSGSVDRTVEIARAYTDKVFSIPNKLNFDINKNFGFTQVDHQWILSLDADERLTEELIQEIRSVVQSPGCVYAGFMIPRRTFVLGQEIHTKDRPIRLFRTGQAAFPEQTVHQQLRVHGLVGVLESEILHYTDNSLFERVQKSNWYSECMAAYWYDERKPFHLTDLIFQPLVSFAKYYLRRGFREGVLGLIIAVNGAYSIFLRYAKLWSAYRQGAFVSPSDNYPPDLA